MSRLTIEDIPSYDGPSIGARARRELAIDGNGIGRRGFIKTAVAAGVGAGLATVGLFPAARKAIADGYEIKDLPCPSYADNHNCEPGCGPSPVCGGGSNGPCCINNNWHRALGDGAGNYKLRPNECYGGWADGWQWSYGSCGACQSIIYKCHDGYKKLGDGSWSPDVCRIIISCFPW